MKRIRQQDPQILNINTDDTTRDRRIVIDSVNVIRDDDQTPMHEIPVFSIPVDINVLELTSMDASGNEEDITMTYNSDLDVWILDIDDFKDLFTDRNKYIAKISENISVTNYDMRDFKLQEFAVDNDSFENVIARLPYEVDIAAGKMYWYETTPGVDPPLYMASIYQDGVDTTPATDPARVTHRGPIVPYAP